MFLHELMVTIPPTRADPNAMSQREALIALYEATGGAHWSSKPGWLQGDDVCAWGIACTTGVCCSSDGLVSSVALRDNNLTGTLPTSIWPALGRLLHLDLSGNELSGSLPSSLFNPTAFRNNSGGASRDLIISPSRSLSNDFPPTANIWRRDRSELFLHHNHFSGTLPTELGLLTVGHLRLGFDQVSGSLPTELGRAGVSELYCDPGFWFGSGPREPLPYSDWMPFQKSRPVFRISGTLPTELAANSVLKELALSYNLKISGTLPTSLALGSMDAFYMSSTRLSGTLPQSTFLRMSSTTPPILQMDRCRLSGTIPTFGLPSDANQTTGPPPLRALALHGNRLSGSIPPYITVNERCTLTNLACVAEDYATRSETGRAFAPYGFENRCGGDIEWAEELGELSPELGVNMSNPGASSGSKWWNFVQAPGAQFPVELEDLAQGELQDAFYKNLFDCAPSPETLPTRCWPQYLSRLCPPPPPPLPMAPPPPAVPPTPTVIALAFSWLWVFVAIVLTLACLVCAIQTKRRGGLTALKQRVLGAYLRYVPTVEMALSSTRPTAPRPLLEDYPSQLDEQLMTTGGLPSSSVVEPLVMSAPPQSNDNRGGDNKSSSEAQALAELGELTRARMADGRLLHMIKGLAGSALVASQFAAEQLDAPKLTASARLSSRRLVTNVQDALQEAIGYLIARQVFSDVESGVYQTQRTDRDVGELLRSALHGIDGAVELHAGDGGGSSDDHAAVYIDEEGQKRLRLAFDARMLRLVVYEALANCRKYREPDTPIMCGASFRSNGGGRLRVTIENRNRYGVDRLTDDECASVLHRGVKGPNATSESTGLGLDTACKAAHAAGGRVALSTREGDDGFDYTCLAVELPAAAPASPPITPPSSPATDATSEEETPRPVPFPPLPSALSLLVADDAPINRLILSYSLTVFCPECVIVEAKDGDEVLQLVEEEATDAKPLGFDIIFIDDDMGDDHLSGSQAVVRLAERRARAGDAAKHVLFVLVTAGADSAAERDRLAALGADLVWNKPLPSEAEMVASLQRKLAAHWGDAAV